MDLSHIMMIEDIYLDYGPMQSGPYVLLFNANRVSREEALRIYAAGEYSPYVLAIPAPQMDGLFRDKPQGEPSPSTSA